MEYKELIRARYSCKAYDSGRQLSPETLAEILEAGRMAPTAKNLQEQHIYVCQSTEALAKIDACTPCRYGAPTVLVVAFDRNNVYTYPDGKRESGIEDAAIVATHLMLGAKDAYKQYKKRIQIDFSEYTCSLNTLFYSFKRVLIVILIVYCKSLSVYKSLC